MVDTVGTLASIKRGDARARPAAAASIRIEALSPEWLARYEAFAACHPHGPAQKPVWTRAWAQHACSDSLALTVEVRGAPWMMLPLEVARKGRFTVARFVGDRHANASFPAFDAALPAPEGLRSQLSQAVRKARPDIDLVLLERMAPEVGGVPNPLALGSAPSPNLALSFSLEGGIEAVLKRAHDRRKAKKHRSHGRRYDEAGGFRRFEAKTDAEIDALLAEFFELKGVRFRKAGITDVFAEAETRNAFRAAYKASLCEPTPSFVIHALEIGGLVRAISGSSRNGSTLTCEFSAIREDELSRHSPGEYLFFENVTEACAQGFQLYDFGVGDEPYKRTWTCDDTIHQDLSLPVSPTGWLFHFLLAGLTRAKTAVKRNPALWNFVKRLRRKAAGEDAPVAEADGSQD